MTRGPGDRTGDGLVAFYQAVDGAQVALRVALAAHRLVDFGGVAMRLDVSGVAFERAQKTSQCVLQLVLLAVEQPQLQVHVGAGGNDGGGAEQVAQRAGQVAFALEQRGEAQVRFEVARLAADQLAVDGKRFEGILVGDAARLFEALAHAGRTEAVLDFAGLIGALEVKDQLPRFALDERGTVAHYDAAFVVDEFERSDGAFGIDERAYSLEASLDRIDMLASAE